jgi:hypothetical protein
MVFLRNCGSRFVDAAVLLKMNVSCDLILFLCVGDDFLAFEH